MVEQLQAWVNIMRFDAQHPRLTFYLASKSILEAPSLLRPGVYTQLEYQLTLMVWCSNPPAHCGS
jgi:hypothetical protein